MEEAIMKTYGFLVLLSFAGAWATDDNSDLLPDPSWAKPVLMSTRREASPQANDDVTCTGPYSCLDCNTAKVCKPTAENAVFSLISTFKCPDVRPYCDPRSGTCVKDAPDNCGDEDKSFLCMGNGKYPDSQCTQFHVCINLKPTLFKCTVPGHKYNPSKQICEQTDVCGSFDCSAGNAVSKAPHSSSPRYFAFCKDAANGILVDACPPSFRLDPDSQTCIPDCQDNGIIPDPADCHFYYKCSRVRVSRSVQYLTSSREKCPEKQAYSPTDFLCVPEEKVKTCKI